MAALIKHAHQTAIPDDPDYDVGADEWNAAHTVEGVVEILDASATLYVRTDGNDANDGLTDSAGGAFLTIARAFAEAAKYRIASSGGDTTIYLGAGTYTEDLQVYGGVTDSPLRLDGNFGAATLAGSISLYGPVGLYCSGLNFASGSEVNALNGATFTLSQCAFVATKMNATYGATITASAITFSGTAAYLARAAYGGVLVLTDIYADADASFSMAFVIAEKGSLLEFTNVPAMAGGVTVTGLKYVIDSGSTMTMDAGTPSDLLGDTSGTVGLGCALYHSGNARFPYRMYLGEQNANSAPDSGLGYDAGLVVFGDNSGAFSGSMSRAFVVRGVDLLCNQNGAFRWGDCWSAYTYDAGIGRNAAGVMEANDGNLGTLRDFKMRNTITPGTTVASLAGAAQGARSFVTDSTVAAAGNFGAVVAGGGANIVPVYNDGTNWRIG